MSFKQKTLKRILYGYLKQIPAKTGIQSYRCGNNKYQQGDLKFQEDTGHLYLINYEKLMIIS